MEHAVVNELPHVVADLKDWGIRWLISGKKEPLWWRMMRCEQYDMIDLFLRLEIPLFQYKSRPLGVFKFLVDHKWVNQSLYFLSLVKAKKIHRGMRRSVWVKEVMKIVQRKRFNELYRALITDPYYQDRDAKKVTKAPRPGMSIGKLAMLARVDYVADTTDSDSSPVPGG